VFFNIIVKKPQFDLKEQICGVKTPKSYQMNRNPVLDEAYFRIGEKLTPSFLLESTDEGSDTNCLAFF